MKTKTVIIILGPTASGKTSAAIEVAQHFNTHIISADSRQCYKELNIGVAKPSSEQLNAVTHYFINSHSIHDELNVKVFEEYALQKVNDIFQTKDVAIMVGGTGLYIKAFCEGIDEIPIINTGIREAIIKNYNQNGLSWLQDELSVLDPEYFATCEVQNPQRLIRALEVKLSTDRSILSFHTKIKKVRDFNIIKIGLELNKDKLYENINTRVDKMVKDGLIEEVKTLTPFQSINALNTVGYQELFRYLNTELSLSLAIAQIKSNTRHYAKRQITWFKKDAEIMWLPSHNIMTTLNGML